MSANASLLEEFAGCLYEAPTCEGGTRDWRIDPTSGAEYPFDLTTNEILNMKFDGVPIKIEHAYAGFTQGDEIGRVRETATDPVTGYTAVKFALHDTLEGRTVARLIKAGTLDSLSLGHVYNTATSSVTASEVSVCFNGARPGTCLYKDTGIYDQFKSNVAVRASSMASEPPQDTLTPDAVVNDDTAAAGPPQPRDLVELLEYVTSVPGSDKNASMELYKQVAGIVGRGKTQDEEAEKQRTLITALEKQVAGNSAKKKSESQKIVSCMNALLAEFVPDNTIIAGGDDAADMHQVAMQVPILASALHAFKHANSANSFEAMRGSFASEIKKAMSPWKEPEQTHAHRAIVQDPGIAINASARGRQRAEEDEPAKKYVRFSGLTQGQQDVLSNFKGYGTGDGFVTRDMIPNHSGKPMNLDLIDKRRM
jgi:hypothetical protein